MNIVVLDDHTINPGRFSWDALKALGSCVIYERTSPRQIVERAIDAQVVVTSKCPFTEKVIEQLPQLKYVVIAATGYNNIDLDAAKERGIPVANVPSYSTQSVAQHTLALLLEIANQVGSYHEQTRSGAWDLARTSCFQQKPFIELDQLTFGIIGYGEIGQAVAKLAQAFGMKVIVSTRTPKKDPSIQWVDQKTLFTQSDVISLHCPLTSETNHLINETTLSLMKPSAVLLNTSRGGLVNEEHLFKALKEKRIFAAGVDVSEKEPPDISAPLFRLENYFITPHIAWAGPQARQRLVDIVVENVESFLKGRPKNLISPTNFSKPI